MKNNNQAGKTSVFLPVSYLKNPKKNYLFLVLSRHFKKAGIGYFWTGNLSFSTTGVNFPQLNFRAYTNDGYIKVSAFRSHNDFNLCVGNDVCILMAKLVKHNLIQPEHIPKSLL